MADIFTVPPEWNRLISAFKTDAVKNLYPWYQQNKRDLPWRNTKDPYIIWVSEIMLQQTRVDQALPFFQRFISNFPTLNDVAKADQAHLLKTWEGLGYYKRVLNMKKAAQLIMEQYQGRFPKDYQQIADLPGIGKYTAAAVAAIAFDLPYAVVDGNVIRVIARFFLVDSPVDKQPTKRQIQWLADSILDRDHPELHNQAMMELGACICMPTVADCDACILAEPCRSKNTLSYPERIQLPKKSPKKTTPHYEVAAGLIWNQGKLLIALRPEHKMLGGLWEFPGGKREPDESLETCCVREIQEELGLVVKVERPFIRVKHTYSHFKITMTVFHCTYVRGIPEEPGTPENRWVFPEELDSYPFPKASMKVIDALLGRGENQNMLFR
jgi:A/G-specific adenine glycosylase